ncbi:hypothetical protein NZK35_31040 [Stieleria sp. ICT_E10.1]|uniref:hypothetical protein n=1 Tax=Stieleria sedimenti TaxID=2976331 RepID=UPI00217F28A2|nr:hypothetical protein [Stieleria sedimenti]MCS7471115.1 hypothetical protein [Stieleria sedimenti]
MRLSRFHSSGKGTRLVASLGLTAVACILVSTQAGCLGLLSNLIHASGADKVPAAYEGLEDSRVAVVTLTENSQYSDDVSARILGRNVMQWLSKEVDDIELIREDKIANWRDTHGWDQVEFAEIGRGVDAEKVLAIEVMNLKLRDGATLYRGHADVRITVIDAKTGEELFTRDIDDFTYPNTAGVYTNETTEARFRKLYLGILGKRVARQFYPYDAHEDFALDSIIAR